MAFSVTPTSGEGPYTLDIGFDNKPLIDGINYSFRLRVQTANGSCPAPGTGTTSLVSDDLLANETVVLPTSVPPGSCNAYSAQILNAQSVVISTQTVFIDNL